MLSRYAKSVFVIAVLTSLYHPLSGKTFFHPKSDDTFSQIKVTDHHKNAQIICRSNRIKKHLDVVELLSSKNSIFNCYRPKLVVTLNSAKDVTIVLEKNSTVEQVDINLLKVRKLIIIGNGRVNVSILKDSNLKHRICRVAKSISICKSILPEADLSGTNLDTLKLISNTILFLNLCEANVAKLFVLKNIRLDSSNFSFTLLPHTIWFHSVDFTRVTSQVDLTKLRHIPLAGNNNLFELERTMKIANTNLDKMRIDYDRFNFHIDSNQTLPNRIWLYEKIIKHTLDNGLMGKYKYYSLEYSTLKDNQNKKWITNTVNVIWWSKGSNKTRALIITCGCYIFFVICNFLLFSKLQEVYYPDTFRLYFDNPECAYAGSNQTKTPIRWHIRIRRSDLNYIFGIFIYTGFIFWGIRLDINDVKIHKQWLFIYLLTQYLIGLLFVANVINFLIVKL
jgi:hypothetical protein